MTKGIEVTRQDDNQIDITVWCCYGQYPKCPDRPCSGEVFDRCSMDCTADNGCVAILEED